MTEDSETEEEEADPWMPMIEEAMQKHKAAFQEMKMNLTQSGLDEETAGKTAYSTQQKMNNLFWPDENSNEQCFAAHIVQCCQQNCSTLLHLIAG